jgi:adenosylcobinamide kinase/adenosylcobinamide-phosphate guanylyltransferase
MAKIIFITGGAASGKTRWAINYFKSCDNVMYMCVDDAPDAENMGRIEYTCKRNDIEWEIKTNAVNMHELVKGYKFSILDNVGAYVNKIIQENCADLNDITDDVRLAVEQKAIDDFTAIIDEINDMNGNIVIISTEIGFCPIPNDDAQRLYRTILGHVNQRIANMCNEVYLSVSGIQFNIKK